MPISVIILGLSHLILGLVRHVCSDKAKFSFLQKKTDAIYSIPYNDCDNEYIGQTKR